MKKNLRVEIDHLFPPERNVDPQLEIDMKKLRDWMEESKEKDRRKEEEEGRLMSDEEKMSAIYRTLAETPVPPSVFLTYRDIELEKIMKEHEERAAEFIKRVDRYRRKEEMRLLVIWFPIITIFPISLLFGLFEWRPVVLGAIVYYALTTFILRTRD